MPAASLTVTSLIVKLAASLSSIVPTPWPSAIVRLESVAPSNCALLKLTKKVSVVSVIASSIIGMVIV